MYRTLDAAKIVSTLERLKLRIDERFPGAGLGNVCAELLQIARQTSARSARIARPNILLRLGLTLLMAAGAGLLAYVSLRILATTRATNDLYGTLQGIDSGFNILVLMGAILFFMFSIEERLKRRRALTALHELRSIIHVIDMHQLTKDPSAEAAVTTPSSPKRELTAFELTRYLDYCTEMLSLAAKVAVLYAQTFPDQIVTEAVNDLERTSSSLSQKIWQKINILHRDSPRLNDTEPMALASAASRSPTSPTPPHPANTP
jgi:hypothetical protein